jgi:hypothetical protein
MPVCPGIKRDGTRCTVVVSGPNDYCYQHDPARAAERRRNASRAARAKPSREIPGIKALLEDLTNRVIGAEDTEPLSHGAGAVAAQLINTRLRAIELERRVRETDEIEERLADIERRLGDAHDSNPIEKGA